jgi:hypothetical protein
MKDYYMFKGEKRFYYPAYEVRTYKPGAICTLPNNSKFKMQGVGGCEVEVISAYYTRNIKKDGWRDIHLNYGRVVKVLTGKKAGKTLRVQT